jgi:hypothetical protein
MINKRYSIQYPNGVIQEKICIDDSLYLKVQSIEDPIEYKKQYKALANEEWFTNKSSFAYALLNKGYFNCYGGPKIIKIKEIKK